ncbi:HNH endonuclease signature motif containing protein [Kribbella sp. NPDC050241]|uniref:HNH endonuclease signature motif containing protein n=1 Tax=Kribbella sp. NPDC050241 TaxID=3364115 RepID=UPI0037BCC2D5
MACDAEILPIVLGSKSQPLDVGTSQRLVTRPMRRALNARDKGCVVCGAPPIQCEAHHVVPWLEGGVTAVSNLVLLCKRHHNDLHSGHWHIRIIDGIVRVTRPAWTGPTAIPPGRYRPPAAPPTHQPTSSTPCVDPWNDGPEPAVHTSTPPPPTSGAPPPFNPWDSNAFTAAEAQRPA